MWTPQQITIKDFGSHEDSTLTFEEGELKIILGKNEDDKLEADSNGAGKSTFIEGITFALTGESAKDVNKVDLIRDGKKAAFVNFKLKNNFLNETLDIERKITKSSAEVVIKINGVANEQLTGVPEANKFILEKIGITKEDLLNFFVINQGNNLSFFKASDTKQKEIISRFIDISVVDKMLTKVVQEKELLVSKISTLKNEIVKIDSKVENLRELIQEEIDRPEPSKEELVKPFKERVEQQKDSIKEHLESVKLNKLKLKSLNIELDSVGEVDDELLENLKELKQQIDGELETLETQLSKSNSQIRKYKSSLGEKIECPSCNHKFILNSELTVKQIEDKLLELDSKISEYKDSKATLSEELESTEEHLEQSQEVLKKKKNINTKIKGVESEINESLTSIEDLERRIGLNENRINQILTEEKEIESKIPEYEAKISELESSKASVLENIEVEEELLTDKDFWIHHLGKKGFQTFLANKAIKTIETYCNYHLEQMNSSIRVQINGFKVLANGDLRDKIEVLIIKGGSLVGKYEKFSGGQRTRANLSSILSFCLLINNSLEGGRGLDLLILDETLDSLDTTGKIEALKILKIFKRTTLIVSHGSSEEKIHGANKVIINYKDKVSRVV